MVRPSRADHILLDHDAAQVVGAEVQSLPTYLDALRQPRHLYIRDIVEVKSGHCQPAPILFSRASIRNLPANFGVVRLQGPGNEGYKATRLLLQLIEPIQVLDAMLYGFS